MKAVHVLLITLVAVSWVQGPRLLDPYQVDGVRQQRGK